MPALKTAATFEGALITAGNDAEEESGIWFLSP